MKMLTGLTCADAFIIAFHEAIDAASFLLNFQQALLTLAWPHEILTNRHAQAEERYDGMLLFKGLRVRAAMHTGIPSTYQVTLKDFLLIA